jgi:metallo-beta-lactamase class B
MISFKCKISALSLFLVFSFVSKSQVVIHIASIAENTPEDATIYFAGNINGWNPGDPAFALEKRADGDHWIDLPDGNGTLEFKFTRGSWDKVESNGHGGFRPNRTYSYGFGVDTLHLDILGWEDLDHGGSNSTANEQVQIWDEEMYMPQLDRNRRIWVYLPKDYDSTNKYYPVLYMQDGQNIFDAYTSFAGEWKVDESLSELEDEGFRGIIVVAIDNGGTHRIEEYSPFVHPDYGGGEGDAYLDFITQTLKPRIDSTFRTLTGPKNTGIMGSSMGGLISHYAHFRHPDIFGRVGIFSPSYWFSDTFFTYTLETGKTDSSRIYMYAGVKEWTILNGTSVMYDQLIDMGYTEDEVTFVSNTDGEHSEYFWALQFPGAVQWLFRDQEALTTKQHSDPGFSLYPNPVGDTLFFEGEGEWLLRIFDLEGKLLKEGKISGRGVIALDFITKSSTLIVQGVKDGFLRLERVVVGR